MSESLVSNEGRSWSVEGNQARSNSLKSFEFGESGTQPRSRSSDVRGFIAVAGGMLIHAVLGTLYCWGNFNSYTPAGMKNFDGSYDPALSKKVDTLNILAYTIVFQSIAMPFSGFLMESMGVRFVVAFSGILCFLGPFLASFASNLMVFVLLYAGILGSGIGFGYTSPLVCGYKHFPESKGIVSGLILGAFGLGGFVFNYIGTAFFNPGGASPDTSTRLYPPEVTDNFGSGLRCLSFIYLLLGLIAAPMLRMPTTLRTVANAGGHSLTILEAIKTPTFWVMWIIVAVSAQGGLYVSSTYKTIALDVPELHDDKFLSMVGALGSLSNGLMRPIWGMLYDRFGFRRCISAVTILQVLILFVFPSLTSSRFLYTCGVVLAYAGLAGNFTLAPAETYRIFGNAAVYGVLYTSFAFAGVFGTKIANGVADMVSSGKDDTPNTDEIAFRLLSFMSFMALVIVQFHGRGCLQT